MADSTETVCGEDQVRGKRFNSVVHDDVVAKTPSWNPRTSPPTVPMAEAIKLCENYLPKIVPNARGWILGSVNLERGYPFESNKWIYKIEFYPPESETALGAFGRIWLVVLMDGTLIKPTVSKLPPRTYRWQVYEPKKP